MLSIAGIETGDPKKPSVDGREVGAVTDDDAAHVAILEAVRAGASDLEDLARSTRLAPRDFASALSTLEVAGRLVVTPTGSVELCSAG
jgi:predicted Rossmann fold nucleotide-binding protein DprA/Smf involved in DNA uptake